MEAGAPAHPPLLAELRTIPATAGLLSLTLVGFAFAPVGGGEAAAEQAVHFGAMERSRFWSGEVYRLATALFLHGGLAHLLGNLGAILVWGFLFERARGSGWMLLVYFVSGAAGFVAALDVRDAVHYGASSAACGVGAAFCVLLLLETRWIGALFYGPAMFFLLLATLNPFASSNETAKVGHFAGAAAGALLSALFPPDPRRPRMLRAARAAVLLSAAAVLAGVIGAPDNKRAALPGLLALRDARERCRAGDPKAVLRLTARAHALGADGGDVAVERVHALRALGAAEAALRELDAAIRGGGRLVALYRERARLREETGDLQGALEDYEQVRSLTAWRRERRACCDALDRLRAKLDASNTRNPAIPGRNP